jgi:spermidine dehydrogenase
MPNRDLPEPDDRELGLDQPITRRDFLNGVAVGLGALGALSPAELLRVGLYPQTGADEYPPALTGLRGSHDGAYEAAHRLRDGARAETIGTATAVDGRYDLVVVGGGISGLAAAHFYRKAAGPNARILILENHDDFGVAPVVPISAEIEISPPSFEPLCVSSVVNPLSPLTRIILS